MQDIKNLLYTDGSLTEALCTVFKEPIRVDVLREFTRPCTAEEASRLQDTVLWQRDVVLSGSTPLILARTRVSAKQLQSQLSSLKNLGDRPLGEWLFSQKQLQKTQFKVDTQKKQRDTLYQLNGATIWVQEIFI